MKTHLEAARLLKVLPEFTVPDPQKPPLRYHSCFAEIKLQISPDPMPTVSLPLLPINMLTVAY
jgi:hypothetical protein